MKSFVHWLLAGSSFASLAVAGAISHADTVVTQPVLAQPPTRESSTTTSPNMGLIGTGILTLGVPYAASVIVAAESDHQGDNNLYVPVAGPWIDLGNRGGCSSSGQPSCDTEGWYKALLVADGVVQVAGAVEIVAAFFFPTSHTVSTTARSSDSNVTVHVSPATLGRGSVGLSAAGTF